jgi:hypothetical protein
MSFNKPPIRDKEKKAEEFLLIHREIGLVRLKKRKRRGY